MATKLQCIDESCAVVFEVSILDAGCYVSPGEAELSLLDCSVCPICGADAEEVEE